MKEPVKIAFGKHAKVKAIVQAAYLGATTRRPVRIECKDEYHVSDYWDGGSRDYATVVDLSKMEMVTYSHVLERQNQNNPMGLPIGNLPVTPGYAIVEHTIFCGKDMGYTIIMNAEDIPIHIPEAASLLPTVEVSTEDEAYSQEIPEKF
jgi:hypothetical protein